jgi:uncharacterized protein (DUF2384 family)
MSEDSSDEYALRVARLKQQLLELFEPAEADDWLHCEQDRLQGRRPVDLLDSELGYLEVSAIIHAILDGTFI